MECCVESLPIQEDRIHVENGTLYLDGSFSEEQSFCRNRLPVRYDPNAGKPVQRFCGSGESNMSIYRS